MPWRVVKPQYHMYDDMALLAAGQSLLILMIILLFCFQDQDTEIAVSDPTAAEIIVSVWAVKHKLAMTGLFLDSELGDRQPAWKDWAMVSARRRTVLSLHHLEWAWSLLRGYPTLTCFELGPLPAPEPGYLWRETDEQTWQRQYRDWLGLWKDGSYKIAELFYINAGEPLSVRAEMWLAEADEFGMMLMAEGIQILFSILC